MDHFLLFMFRVCSLCSLMVTCWDRADLLALPYAMFYCFCVTLPCLVLGQVWYLIVLTPGICPLSYFNRNSCKMCV